MEDTLDVVVGMRIVVAGECEERVVLEDQFPKGIDIAFIASQKYPSAFSQCPGYDLVGILTKPRTLVKPYTNIMFDTLTCAESSGFYAFQASSMYKLFSSRENVDAYFVYKSAT